MKHHITIRPLAGTKGGRLVCDRIKYKDGKEYACLKHSQKAVLRDLLKPSDEPISQYITTSTTVFSFSYDDDPKADIGNKDRKFMAEVLKYHSMIHMEGFKNPRMGAVTLFEMEDLAANDIRNFQSELLLLTAKNKAHKMSYQEKTDAYYFYGENPLLQTEEGYVTMDHRQLSLRLWAGDIGVILRRSPFGNTGMTYLEHFVKEYKKGDETYMLKTVILKSLILRDGEDKPLIKKDGAAYFLGSDIIGSSVDECVAWLNNNPKRKKFLVDMVEQSDVIGVDNLDEAMLEPEGENVEQALEESQAEDAIRAEAKSMKIMNHWNMNLKDLTKEIEKVRPIWKEVKNLGLQSKIDSMKKPTIENITILVENEKKRLMEVPA